MAPGGMEMGFNRKAKGTRAELRAIKQLEAAGFSCTRAAASLGVWDVIAVGVLGVRLIQVKCNRPPGRAERETMAAFQAPENCTKELWVYHDGRPRDPVITVIP